MTEKPAQVSTPTRSSSSKRADRGVLATLVAFALIPRLFVVAYVYRGLAGLVSDPGRFGGEMGWVARSIVLGHGFSSPFLPVSGSTALVPPVFPYLLALDFRVFGLYSVASSAAILGFDSLLSALMCIPIYFLARNSFNPRVARLAGWVWVIYPTAIYFASGEVWDYALTAFLFTNCLWAIQRIHLHSRLAAWAGLGLLCGITILSNPAVLPVLAVLSLLAAARRGVPTRTRWTRGCLVAVSCIVVLAPWAVRNYRTMHVVSPIRDGFWLEFWAGNYGNSWSSNPPEAHPATNPVEMRQFLALGETAYLANKHELSAQIVAHRPFFVARLTLRRVLRYWTGYWSLDRAYLNHEPFELANIFFCSGLTMLMLRGVGRCWRDNRRRVLPYLLVLALFPISYYVTHASMDYRQPIESVVAILVTVGIFGASGSSLQSIETSVQSDRSAETELQPQ